LVVLGLAVVVAQLSYCFHWSGSLVWLLVVLGLSVGFCWILVLALVGLDSWCVGLFDWALVVLS